MHSGVGVSARVLARPMSRQRGSPRTDVSITQPIASSLGCYHLLYEELQGRTFGVRDLLVWLVRLPERPLTWSWADPEDSSGH